MCFCLGIKKRLFFLLHHNITVTSSMFFFFPKFLLLINNSIYYFYYFRTHNPTIKFIKIPVSLCFPFVLVLGSMVIIISRMMTPFSEEPPAFCSMMRPNFINQCWARAEMLSYGEDPNRTLLIIYTRAHVNKSIKFMLRHNIESSRRSSEQQTQKKPQNHMEKIRTAKKRPKNRWIIFTM